MRSSAGNSTRTWGVAFASLAAALLLRWLLDPVLGNTFPVTAVVAAAALTVWIGGYRPALVVAGLGFLACTYFFVEPRGQLHLGEPRNIVGLVLNLLTITVLIGLVEALRYNRDSTVRRRAEAQLRRDNETFSTLIQKSPFGVYVVDADFRLHLISLGAQNTFAAVPQAEGRDFGAVVRTLWPEPFASEVLARFRHTLDTGEAYTATGSVERRADIGDLEEYDWRIERIGLPDGRYGVVCYFYDLSKRQQWELTLLRSEERLRLATEAAELGIWTWEPGGDVVVWENDRPYDIFGMERTEAPVSAARFRTEFLHPEDVETFETAFMRGQRADASVACECRIRRSDGAIRWLGFTGQVVEGAEPRRLIGTVQDITDRRNAEDAVRASEARHSFTVALADTLRPLSDPVAVQAKAGRLLGERLGASRVVYFDVRDDHYVVERDYTSGAPSIAGRHPIRRFGEDMLAVFRDGRTAIEADVQALASLSAVEKAAFTSLQVRSYIAVPLIKDGVFVAGLAVHSARERTWSPTEVAIVEETAERTWAALERVRAEAALRESEERSAFVRKSSGVGFWYCDLPFDVLQWDDLVKAHFHLAPDAHVTIETFYQCIHPDDREPTRRAIERSITGRSRYNTDFRTVHPDTGAITWVRAIGRTFYAADGTPTRFDGVTFDVSEQKRAEAELREADRRKDEFLATLAHELRNPLAPLRNGLELIRLARASGPVEQARSMMERQLGQMIRLVDDLLDVSRVTTGRLELRRERVELRTVIAAALETSQPVIEQAGHELAVVIPDEPVVVDGDPVRLAQAVANLLLNSAKYTPRGGHIRVTVSRDGAAAVVAVADDGTGIPTDMLETVFGMFTRVDRTLEKTTGGLGIGLSLVKRLVEMHGGTVMARSEGEGRGSEFIVRLPSSPAIVEHRARPDAADPELRAGRLRILIADDNIDSAESLGEWLRLLGNEVRTARDGAEAVEVAGMFRPDVILLDIAMPKLNGYEACRRIREQPWREQLVLVAMTGWGQEEDKLRSLDMGFDYHLVKPVDPGALERLLGSLRAVTT